MNRARCLSITVLLLLTTPAFAQNGGIICCNQLIDVGGDWVTADRNRCIDYMNESTSSRAKVCAHLLRGECAASVDAGQPVVDSLLALLLPAAAQAQSSKVVVIKYRRNLFGGDPPVPVGCRLAAWDNEIRCTVMDVSGLKLPPPPTVCCPEAAALCEESSCKDDPAAQGFVHSDARGTGRPGELRSEPSQAASSLGTVPNGSRLPYTEFRRIGGQTWFYVRSPGGKLGWLPAESVSCERPQAPPPSKPVIVKPSGPSPARSTGGGLAGTGARG